MAPGPLSAEAKIAVLERRQDEVERELLRVREGVHNIRESLGIDRSTMAVIGRNVADLSQRMSELPSRMEELAQRAADKAVAQALDQRDERWEGRRENRRKSIGMGLAGGGLLSTFLIWLVDNLFG